MVILHTKMLSIHVSQSNHYNKDHFARRRESSKHSNVTGTVSIDDLLGSNVSAGRAIRPRPPTNPASRVCQEQHEGDEAEAAVPSAGRNTSNPYPPPSRT